MALPKDKVDAIVVGSGATGSLVAARLAQAGKSVHILEAGSARSSNDMVSSTLWARRLKWTGPPVVETGANPVGHAFNAGFGVGGSAIHHYAVWPRMHAEDFDMATRYGKGLDWPIGYQDLAPHYDAVQTEAGVSGDAEKEIWRPEGAPYPMPPVPLFAQGRLLARAFENAGKVTAPLPLAVTTQTYNGRPICLWDGWCDAGCPIGALANPLTIHLPAAIQAGATLHTDTPVTKLLTDASGERLTGVEVVSADGTRTNLQADVVVLAAFAVQNPRLMLASANDKHPEGLGNSSGTLGKYIMTHAAGLVYGLFDEATECSRGAFGGQLVNQDSYPKLTHEESGAFGSYQWMIAQAVRPNDLLGIATTRPDLFGKPLKAFMQKAANGFASMTAVVEDMPVADNALTLSSDTDPNGVPLATVHHTTAPESTALWQASLAEGTAVFEGGGAKEVWTGPPGAMHIMGGTIMGDDASRSVTNGFGQSHDVENLFVTGPGLYPTSAGVNPTFTALALADRSSQYLIDNWSAIAT